MLKISAAILLFATPALGADKVISSHEVKYQDQTFICGEVQDQGRIRRYIHSIPEAKYIPEFEPSRDDPLARSWQITYRIICEGGSRRPHLTANAGRRKY